MTNGTATPQVVNGQAGDLVLVAHRGDRSVLLAMDLPQEKADRLAGFALYRTPPGKRTEPLLNRLAFDYPVTKDTTPDQRRWHPSDRAPFQKFRWVDMPTDILAGTYQYTATARYWDATGKLVDGPSATVAVDILDQGLDELHVGFTRGYISSQAYVDRWNHDPIEPDPPTMDFETAPYAEKYAWLGFHGRELIFEFLDACVADPAASLDVFAFDLNEPDIIRRLVGLGSRLRLFLDDSTTHRDDPSRPDARPALETGAASAILAAGGQVRRGHFARLAHSKVFIGRLNGVPMRLLAGSANFSVRGLYVQANNVLVFESPDVAALFASAFERAWASPTGSSAFRGDPISRSWHPLAIPAVAPGAVAFSPHTDSDLSLEPVLESINAANSSVLFAVMDLSGGGDVLKALRDIADRQDVFSYGITQSSKDFALYKPGSRRGIRIPFAYLSAHVPAPFRAEWDGGFGQVIHHKFVVVDFNGDDPVVYTGSSNLARGGEEQNGDNLLELHGGSIASLYAVEAVRQIDHYHFRASMLHATVDEPLVLRGPDQWHAWVDPYYDPGDLKSVDRRLFARQTAPEVG